MKEIYILGAKINDLSLDEAISAITKQLQTEEQGYIVTPNPEICLLAYKDKNLRRLIQKSFISIPDGFGLKIGAIFWHKILKNTTTGADLTERLINIAEQNNYSILFFEGRPLIGDRVLSLLSKKNPNLKIKFLDPGNVDKHGNCENTDLIKQINEFQPTIILVNLGAPKQEYFISKNLPNLNTKLMIGVGGSLDFLAGTAKRAPLFMRRLGLEWLWRLITEPWRWSRIFKAVIIFPISCIKFRLSGTFIYRKNVAGFIINSHKQILITKQAQNHYWQIPQGGAKKSKNKNDYEQAVMREMLQELGTDKFQILDWCKNCYRYEWPQKDKFFDQFRGQKQSLFLLQFTGNDNDIKLDPHEHSAYQWVNKETILSYVKDFKKPLIQIALNKFNNYL